MTVLSLSELVNYLHDAPNKIWKHKNYRAKLGREKQLQK